MESTENSRTSGGSFSNTFIGHDSDRRMFNIKARIFDGGEVTCLRLTNKDVETLLKVSCDQVLASIEAADYTDFPEILGCLIDQQLLFLVEVNQNIPSNEHGCYKATRVCQHAKIIRMFLRRELFSPHNTAMPTIGRLLGQEGRGSSCQPTIWNLHYEGQDGS